MKHTFWKKMFATSLSLMFIASAGLGAGKPASANSDSQDEGNRTLKVLYWNAEAFNQTYGRAFSKAYPNMDVQVIAAGGTGSIRNYDAMITKHSPDLVMLDPNNYKQLSKADKLVNLEPLIERDSYDTTTLYPGLLKELKKQGGGELNGLSPMMQSYVLLYNADLFNKYNITLPKDGMTWSEVLKLAAKFPTKGDKNTRIWGLSSYGSANLAMDIAKTEGLSYMDPTTLKASANTADWKSLYRTTVDATKSGALDEGIVLSAKSYLESSPFIMGRSAMAVAPISRLQHLQSAKSAVKNYKAFNVGIASAPADSKERNSTGNVYVTEIFAIPSEAANVDAAWEFIKYFHGDDYAKEYYKGSSLNGPLSRMVKEYAGFKLDKFYKLRPNLDVSINNSILMNKSANLQLEFHSILTKELKLAADKKKTIEQAAASIQSSTQAAGDKLKK